MSARISIALIAVLLFAASCTTTAGGDLPMPVWAPQITDATFVASGERMASVTVDWRTGQAPFTVDIEMPDGFAQLIEPITTSERTATTHNVPFVVPEGTSGLHTYTVKIRVIDALGQVIEKHVDAQFNFPDERSNVNQPTIQP
jgi:hypothetical protein